MESAEGILGVMQQANLEPSNETYCTLMCGYARRGDTAAINRLITECKVKDVLLSDRDTLEIAYTAAVHDHNQLVDEVSNIKSDMIKSLFIHINICIVAPIGWIPLSIYIDSLVTQYTKQPGWRWLDRNVLFLYSSVAIM